LVTLKNTSLTCHLQRSGTVVGIPYRNGNSPEFKRSVKRSGQTHVNYRTGHDQRLELLQLPAFFVAVFQVPEGAGARGLILAGPPLRIFLRLWLPFNHRRHSVRLPTPT
jgi:hypothetical protein